MGQLSRMAQVWEQSLLDQRESWLGEVNAYELHL